MVVVYLYVHHLKENGSILENFKNRNSNKCTIKG